MGLQSFERALGNIVDGVFSRGSSSSIRPVELGRRLLREMDDHRNVDVKGRRIVPNAFVFHLSAKDHTGFAPIERELVHELVEAAREFARDEGYHFIGPVTVDLAVDNGLKPGRFGISSQLRDTPAPAARAAAPAASYAQREPDLPRIVPAAEPVPTALGNVADLPYVDEPTMVVGGGLDRRLTGQLLLPNGERVAVDRVLTLGRMPECSIALHDPNVSRRHAEIRPATSSSTVTVVDLGSTNGTKVNGLRISGPTALTDGDIVSLGSTHLRYEAAG
jgi:hypothetical protein